MSVEQRYLKRGRRERVIAKREAALSKKLPQRYDNATQITFTFYVIAIAAKLARIDSAKTTIESEIDSFKEIFSIPENEHSKIEGFYRDAANDHVPASHYAKQLTNLFPNNRMLLEELIDDLFIFADADSSLTPNKVKFLKEVVLSLRFNENYFGRMLRKHLIKSSSDPFELLGVTEAVTYVDLKKSYRTSIRDCHPDKFSHENIMPELKEIAKEQFNYYTQAYEAIMMKKGFNKKLNNE